MPLILTRSASGVLLQLFLLPGGGPRGFARAATTEAPSTPGRLGYGDVSGREIQEKQKPPYQDLWLARPEIAILQRDNFRRVSGNAQNGLQSTLSENTAYYIHRLAIHGD